MPDVPAACQGIADALAGLQAQAQALANQAETETGAAAWQTLAELGRVRAQVSTKQQDLDSCIAASSADLTGTLTIIDVRSNPPAETPTILLWDFDDPAAAAIPASIQASAFGFSGPAALPASKAVAVASQVAGTPVGAGFDFRTGELPANRKNLPIELLLLPDVTFDEATLNTWASTVQLPVQKMTTSGGPFAPVNVGPTTFSVSLASGTFMVTLHTTVAGTGAFPPLVSTTPHPVSATLPVVVHPDMNPLADPMSVVKITVGDPVQIQDGGLFGGVASGLAPVVFGFVRTQFEQQITDWLNAQLPVVVAAAFAIDAVPAGCTVSVRSVEVAAAGMTVAGVVGDLGNALSTFTPSNLNG